MKTDNNVAEATPSNNITDIQWQTIFNAIGNPAIILDRDHLVVAANDASIRLTGMQQNEIIGKYCFEVFHHRNSGAPAAGCPMERMLQSGVMETSNMEIEALGGVFLVSCTPVLAADGSLDKVIHIASDITARKDAERKLVVESAFNKSIIDNAPEGVCVCHAITPFPHTLFTVWNNRMEAITGYTIEEINAVGWYQTLFPDPEVRANAVERMKKMMKGHSLPGERWQITNRQGEERVVAIWTNMLHLEDDIDHVMAFFIDVTEHKKLEEQHDQSRLDWEDTFQSINDAITILDNDYNIIRANKASEELLCTPLSSLTRHKCYESYHGLDHPMPNCPTCKTMANGQPSCGEYFEAHLGKYLELKAFPRIGHNGENRGIIHVVRDITERKRADMAVKEQKNFYDNLIQNSTVAMFILDSKHNVVIWNKACENLTGFSEADVVGSNNHWRAFYEKKQPTLADVIIDGDFDRLPKLYAHAAKSKHNLNGYRAEGWFLRINGKDRYFIIEAAPIYDSKGKMTHALETISDLTESKSLEEQLMHSQKMESIGQLAGGIAHEFNNILAVILGYSQVMRNAFEPDSAAMKDIDQIMTAAERAAVLTKGLLAFSRKQHVALKNMDISILVHNTLKSFSRIMGDDVLFNESLDTSPLMANIDPALVTQVLMNLMANARDAMPNGGWLDVRTQKIQFNEPHSSPFCSIPPGTYAQISLTDNGCGIDEETLPKIFEPFFTTKEVGKGTGLGLAVVHGIVSQHNGYICVSSATGQGTTFDLYFPLIDQQSSPPSAIELSACLPGGNETILLADDESTLLTLFSDILSELGYHVITATGGVDAVNTFIANKDTVKLLILDVQMPGMSGLQAYKEIKVISPECRVLFVSGCNEEQFQGDKELEEGTELLNKPFKPADLAGRVRKLLDAGKL